MRKKVAVVTSNRADYGLLSPLIRRINEDSDLELLLLVTGAHLSEKYGMTIREIEEDGYPISAQIRILTDGNTPYDSSISIANAITGFAGYFKENRPDMLVILGDRTEMLGVAIAAMNENIMIAHIHGGEITLGAVDDCVRHAITKMSYLHFTGTEEYRKRVVQLGENPERVFNVGTLGVENILNTSLATESEIRKDVGIPENTPYCLVTLHPETTTGVSPEFISKVLCSFMEEEKDFFFVITSSNSDPGGEIINNILRTYVNQNSNAVFVVSLGMKRYLSTMKYARMVIGNSSSGMLEAPVLGVTTINLGERQSGRLLTDSIINIPFDTEAIKKAFHNNLGVQHEGTTVYGTGDTSLRMINKIREVLASDNSNRKSFYDIVY